MRQSCQIQTGIVLHELQILWKYNKRNLTNPVKFVMTPTGKCLTTVYKLRIDILGLSQYQSD